MTYNTSHNQVEVACQNVHFCEETPFGYYRDIQCSSATSLDKYRIRTRVAQKRLSLFGKEITKKISVTSLVHRVPVLYIHILSVEQVLLLPLLS